MYNIYVLLVIGDLAENLASYLDEADKFSNFSNTNLCVLIFSILIDESFVSIFHRKNLTSLSNLEYNFFITFNIGHAHKT